MTEQERVTHLIKRLARIDADDSWNDGVNPVQRMALEYLSRANRFSRKPSHVADFMGSTRGTISQTLKSLAAKGYIAEERSETDRRSISYTLTEQGRNAVTSSGILGRSLESLPATEILQLGNVLRAVLEQALKHNDHRSFGVCHRCQHFTSRRPGGYCNLLDVPLSPAETEKICFEQVPA